MRRREDQSLEDKHGRTISAVEQALERDYRQMVLLANIYRSRNLFQEAKDLQKSIAEIKQSLSSGERGLNQ